MKSAFLFFFLNFLVSQSAWAHPGHAVSDPAFHLREFSVPQGLLLALVLLLVVAVARRRGETG